MRMLTDTPPSSGRLWKRLVPCLFLVICQMKIIMDSIGVLPVPQQLLQTGKLLMLGIMVCIVQELIMVVLELRLFVWLRTIHLSPSLLNNKLIV